MFDTNFSEHWEELIITWEATILTRYKLNNVHDSVVRSIGWL